MDGESSQSYATDGTTSQPVPNSPSIADAKRLDKTKIKVTIAPWNGGNGTDILRVLRSQDDGPWVEVSPSGPAGSSSTPIEFEDPAPSDHDYRYVAIVVGVREGIGLNTVASNPSNEMRVTDIAFSAELGKADNTTGVEGDFSLGGFIPDDYVSVDGTPAPDPFEPPGPYTETLPYGPTLRASGFRAPGTLKRGEIFQLDSMFRGSGDQAWCGITVAEWWVFYLTSWDFLPHDPPPWWYSVSGTVWAPDLTFTGDALLGFDGRSNPKWQMLPVGLNRQIDVQAAPITTNPNGLGMSRPIIYVGKNPAGQNEPSSVECSPLVTGSQITVSHLTGIDSPILKQHKLGPNPPDDPYFAFVNWDTNQEYVTVRGALGVDIRPRYDLTVGVYPVYRRVRTILDPDGPGTRVPTYSIEQDIPSAASIAAELNQSFGNRANVWFTATIEDAIEFDDWDDNSGDDHVAENTWQAIPFAAIANGDGHRVSVFVFAVGRWGQDYNGRFIPLVGLASANAIPGNYVFVDSFTLEGDGGPGLIAHEVGHCLGLQHAFAESNPIGTRFIPDIANERVIGYGHPNGRQLIKPERDIVHDNIQEPLPQP